MDSNMANDRGKDGNFALSALPLLSADQAAIAAFFSACFFVLADSPVKLIPAIPTVQVKVGTCPGPDLTVV